MTTGQMYLGKGDSTTQPIENGSTLEQTVNSIEQTAQDAASTAENGPSVAQNTPSRYNVDLNLKVGHAGFGVSQAYIVHTALGDYVQKMLPHLVHYHQESAEYDEYGDAIQTLNIIESALDLQEVLFMKLLDMAEDNAFPDRKRNFERNLEREAEQDKKYRDLFRAAIPQKKEVNRD